jgi:TonB family protein
MTGSVVWPLVARLMAPLSFLPAALGDASVLPSVQSAAAVIYSLPPTVDSWIDRLDSWLMAVWGMASIILLARLAAGFRLLTAIERTAETHTIDGVPVLMTSALGPAVFGIRRLRYVMPQWLLDLDSSLRELVMRHELEHSRAHDPQLTLVAAIAVALMPWNPALWWIGKRLRLAVEMDCDARVLRVAPDRERYARLLILIAQRRTRTTVATMLASSPSNLNRRIAGMSVRHPANTRLRLVALSIAAAAAVACSSKYGADLVTSPTAGATAATEVVTYFSPEGATPAVLVEHPSLVYPARLRSSAVKGEVVAMFVVDSSGSVLDGSLRIVRSPDSLFTQSVRTVVAGMRFNPPALNGKRIRQLVQQSFVFDPTGSATPVSQVAQPTTDPSNRNPMPLRPIVTSRRGG